MVKEAFNAAFGAMSARLAEMRKEHPGSGGKIEAKVRGRFSPVRIAIAEPGKPLKKEYQESAAGLIVVRPRYSELLPYWDIYTLTAVIFGDPGAE